MSPIGTPILQIGACPHNTAGEAGLECSSVSCPSPALHWSAVCTSQLQLLCSCQWTLSLSPNNHSGAQRSPTPHFSPLRWEKTGSRPACSRPEWWSGERESGWSRGWNPRVWQPLPLSCTDPGLCQLLVSLTSCQSQLPSQPALTPRAELEKACIPPTYRA